MTKKESTDKKVTGASFFRHLKGDLFGGLTAGIVALPLALAFGVQSGLGAPAGLYGAIFISFFAALFGGTATQISRHPESRRANERTLSNPFRFYQDR